MEYKFALGNFRFTTLYHPQPNPTERVNRVLKSMLSSFVEDNHRNGDEYLPRLFALLY